MRIERIKNTTSFGIYKGTKIMSYGHKAITTPKMTPQQAVACSKVQRDKTTGRFIKSEVNNDFKLR